MPMSLAPIQNRNVNFPWAAFPSLLSCWVQSPDWLKPEGQGRTEKTYAYAWEIPVGQFTGGGEFRNALSGLCSDV